MEARADPSRRIPGGEPGGGVQAPAGDGRVGRPRFIQDGWPRDRVGTWVRKHSEIIVLLYLLEAPATGRELTDRVSRDTGVLLGPGGLYPLLHRLEREGWLASSPRGLRQVLYAVPNRAEAEEAVRGALRVHRELVEFLQQLLEHSARQRTPQCGPGARETP